MDKESEDYEEAVERWKLAGDIYWMATIGGRKLGESHSTLEGPNILIDSYEGETYYHYDHWSKHGV